MFQKKILKQGSNLQNKKNNKVVLIMFLKLSTMSCLALRKRFFICLFNHEKKHNQKWFTCVKSFFHEKHKLRIYVTFIPHVLHQYAFSMFSLLNNNNHKWSMHVVSFLHELILHAFSSYSFVKTNDRKLSI